MPSGTTGWLRELTADDGLTGFMPPPLPDAARVLNASASQEPAPSPVAGWAAPGTPVPAGDDRLLVAGPAPLVGALLTGPEIEAVRLPWAP